jgi:hypothetical protein
MDAQGAIDHQLLWLGVGGFADMQRAAIALAESRRRPALDREGLAQSRPTVVDASRVELDPKELHALVSQHGNEQISVGAIFLVMVDRPQAQFTLQTAKHTFQVGQQRIGTPEPLFIPVELMGTQAHDRTRNARKKPGDRNCYGTTSPLQETASFKSTT